jgi:2-dehydro-3-deoxygluconokinase
MIIEQKIVTLGEILLRLSTPNSKRLSQSESFDVCYGGSESNVAVSLANLGHFVSHVTRLPKNEIAESAVASLQKHKVNTKDILYGGNRLGAYFLESGAGLRAAKVIYDRAASSMAEATPGMFNWSEIFKNTKWLHWSGITAAISQSAADTVLEALEAAQNMGITISVDMNYRAKLWKYGKTPGEVMEKLLSYCNIIFGGIDAPEIFFGIVPYSKSTTKIQLMDWEIQTIANQMFEKFPKAKLFGTTLRYIKSSNHHQLQGVLVDHQNLIKANLYDMNYMLDRVGGGDAFMGGLIHGLVSYGNDYQKIVDFATAHSVLKHYVHGDTAVASIHEVEALMNGGGSAISR